jgi:sugar (pentulose or hexulose) kinase
MKRINQDVILVFDIGKTNKKVLLFDRSLKILHEEETIFPEIEDDEGFKGDDIEKLESWILEKCRKFLEEGSFEVRGITFTTYGATLMYLDGNGNRLTPVYNYLKPMPGGIAELLYDQYGGKEEFCRRTASPALGMLNSGLQALWLREKKPAVFERVSTILHFPQYLSHLLTGVAASEHTSIGCHTALWDFDRMGYHPWTQVLGKRLPGPLPVGTAYPSVKLDRKIPVGIGIHDSSSSLVPYFMHSNDPFILVSTGTWCISMNPFNSSPLTPSQLNQDCLAYMSIQQKPVKSSRLFLGHIHDVNTGKIASAFGLGENAYKKVSVDEQLILALWKKSEGQRVFFHTGVPDDSMDKEVLPGSLKSFEEAYHRLVMDLVDLTVHSIGLITELDDETKNIYITGGFSKNPIFVRMMATRFPDKKVYTSEVANATSLGAAMVMWNTVEPGFAPPSGLGLTLARSVAGIL